MKAVIDAIIIAFMACMLCVYIVMNIVPQKIQTPEGAPEAYIRKAHYLAHELLIMIRGTDSPLLSLDVRGRGRLNYKMTTWNTQGTDRDGDSVYCLRIKPELRADLEKGMLNGAEWINGKKTLSLRAAGRNILRFPGRKVYLLDDRYNPALCLDLHLL